MLPGVPRTTSVRSTQILQTMSTTKLPRTDHTPFDEVDGLAAVLGSVRELPPDQSNEATPGIPDVDVVAEGVNSSDVSAPMGSDNCTAAPWSRFCHVGRNTCWPSGVPACRQSVAVRCYKLSPRTMLSRIPFFAFRLWQLAASEVLSKRRIPRLPNGEDPG
jgi:hypothetical protein